MRKNPANSEKKMDLIRQIAMSGPSRNCMNSIAIRPPTVVSELAPISGMDLESAIMTASRMGSTRCSSLKRLQKMIA